MKNSYYIAIDDKERSRIIQSNRLDLSHQYNKFYQFPQFKQSRKFA